MRPPPIARNITLPDEQGAFRLLNPVNPCYLDGPCRPCELDARINSIGYGHPDTEQTWRFLQHFDWADITRDQKTTVFIQHGHHIRLDNKDRTEHPRGGVWQYWQWNGSEWENRPCGMQPPLVQRLFVLVCVEVISLPPSFAEVTTLQENQTARRGWL